MSEKLANYLNFKPYPDVYFDTINSMAMVDSSIPFFIIAPPSGAKTTIIKALEQIYADNRFVYTLERISPMRFLKLQYKMRNNDNLLLAEDFSTLGDDEGAVFKMATMIAKLSYDKKYVDPFFTTKDSPEGLILIVKSLAFVCGMQPLWMQIYGAKEVFETLIMEKILRYYRLPIAPIKEVSPMNVVIKSITEAVKHSKHYRYKPHKILIKRFADSVKVQCGARGIEYAKLFVPALAKYVPKKLLSEWVFQTVQRFNFERQFLLRWYEPLRIGIKHEAEYRQYTVLFFAMQYNTCTYDSLKDFVKIRAKTKSATFRYMRFLLRLGLESGYINVLRKGKTYIIPSNEFQKLSIHNFKEGVLHAKAK